MSKAPESCAQPPSYATIAQPGASYPQQQYPAEGFPYQPAPHQPAPPPYSQGGEDDKRSYNQPSAYQNQHTAHLGYYTQPVAAGAAGEPFLIQPQAVQMFPIMPNPPETHMLFSVLATLCCCWPIGIFAIMRSLEVSNAIARGDRDLAERSSVRAYQLAKYAVIAGVVCTIITVICVVVFYAIILSDFYD